MIMTRLKTLWAWIGKNEGQIKIVASVTVGIWILTQFYISVANKEIERSLKYIERSQKDPIYSTRLDLDLFWLSEEGRKLLPQDKINTWEDNATKVAISRKQDKLIYSLILFYNDVAICANEGLCNSEVLCDFFGKDMDALITLYSGFLKDVWGSAWGTSFTYNIRKFLCEKCEKCNKK